MVAISCVPVIVLCAMMVPAAPAATLTPMELFQTTALLPLDCRVRNGPGTVGKVEPPPPVPAGVLQLKIPVDVMPETYMVAAQFPNIGVPLNCKPAPVKLSVGPVSVPVKVGLACVRN